MRTTNDAAEYPHFVYKYSPTIQHMVASDNIALFVHTQAAVGITIVSKTNIQALLHNKLLKALDMG